MGSETIPPCKENVVHINFDKPIKIPNCQFKLLRESVLLKKRAKEIHSRLEQPINDRPIYHFEARKIKYIQTLRGIAKKSFMKYLLIPKKLKKGAIKGFKKWGKKKWGKPKKGCHIDNPLLK